MLIERRGLREVVNTQIKGLQIQRIKWVGSAVQYSPHNCHVAANDMHTILSWVLRAAPLTTVVARWWSGGGCARCTAELEYPAGDTVVRPAPGGSVDVCTLGVGGGYCTEHSDCNGGPSQRFSSESFLWLLVCVGVCCPRDCFLPKENGQK